MNPDAPTALASSVKSFAAEARAERATAGGEGGGEGGGEDAICPDPFTHRCVSHAAEPGSWALSVRLHPRLGSQPDHGNLPIRPAPIGAHLRPRARAGVGCPIA